MAGKDMPTYTSMGERLSAGMGGYPPPGKGGQMDVSCMGGTEEEKASYINTLKRDLANTQYWSGNFFKDYLFYIANWHPLLGMLLCHPHHPWGKRQRFQMALLSLCLTMPLSVYIAEQAKTDHASSVEVTVKTVLLVTIPDTIIDKLLYQLSIAETRCPACASIWNAINTCCTNCFFVVAIISSLWCYLMLKDTDIDWVEAFHPLVLGKLYSYATWFPLFFLLPKMGFLHKWYTQYKAIKEEEQEEEQEAAAGGSLPE